MSFSSTMAPKSPHTHLKVKMNEPLKWSRSRHSFFCALCQWFPLGFHYFRIITNFNCRHPFKQIKKIVSSGIVAVMIYKDDTNAHTLGQHQQSFSNCTEISQWNRLCYERRLHLDEGDEDDSLFLVFCSLKFKCVTSVHAKNTIRNYHCTEAMCNFSHLKWSFLGAFGLFDDHSIRNNFSLNIIFIFCAHRLHFDFGFFIDCRIIIIINVVHFVHFSICISASESHDIFVFSLLLCHRANSKIFQFWPQFCGGSVQLHFLVDSVTAANVCNDNIHIYRR